jgi:hypothetical protein
MRATGIVLSILALWWVTAAEPRAAEAWNVQGFVQILTQYTSVADRPVLMLSRGTAIAWIPDPLDLPKNFNDYMAGDKQKLLPVSVGTAMMAFPPRGPQACRGRVLGLGGQCSPLPGTDRGTSSDFVLVLTAEGLWGVLDRRRSVDVLNEDDLRPVATAEKTGARFAITNAQILNVDIAAGDQKLQDFFPQGQLLRISDESDESNIIVDLAGDDVALKDIPAFRIIRAQFQQHARSAGIASIRDHFKLPVGKIIHVQILERLVPADAAGEWLSSKKDYSSDPNGTYSKILLRGGVFSFTRVTEGQDRQLGCGEEYVSKSNWETAIDATSKQRMGVTAKADFGYFGGTAELEALAQEQFKKDKTLGSTQTVKSQMWQSLRPVEILDKDGRSSTFWAGKAKTCSAPTIWTLMADSTPPLVEPDAVYLHPNFDHIASSLSDPTSADARSATEQLKVTEKDLDQISPGGNPFKFDTGVLSFKCLSQAIAFSNLLREKMAAAPENRVDTVVAVVIARATEPIRRNGDAMRAFAPDAACH